MRNDESRDVAAIHEAPEGEPQEAGEESLIDLLLAPAEEAPQPAPLPPIEGVVVGTIAAMEDGRPLVIFPGGPAEALPARAMAALTPADVGREAALLFEGADARRPVVMGLMHVPRKAAGAGVEVDGERLVFEAKKEIVLRCGKSSITLTRAGKVLIRGAYLLTRASGVNRIQGGSVEIN
jgi:hypothetical protein